MAEAKEYVAAESALPTEEEKLGVKKLKELLNDEQLDMVDDNVLLRFVRGYWKENDRGKAAYDSIVKTLKFRKEIKADSLLNAELELEAKFHEVWPHDYHGFSKEGHPIYIEKTGTLDPSVLLKSLDLEKIKVFHTQGQEILRWRCREQSKKTGKLIYKCVVIMDMYDFGYKHLSSEFYDPIKAIISIDQNYYPETLRKLYLINCPFYFTALWKVIKPWLHPLTAARIEILGTGFLSNLEELIDSDQIPKYLGGTCKCCKAGRMEKNWEERLERVIKQRKERLSNLKPEETLD